MSTSDSQQDAKTVCEAIDEQHDELLGIIEDLQRATEDEEVAALVRSLRHFATKAKAHFDYEEQIMTLYDYPFHADHEAQHADLSKALEAAIDNCPPTRPAAAFLEVTRHLTSELRHCISADDHLKQFLLGTNLLSESA